MGAIQAPRRLAELGERGLGELLVVLSDPKKRKADLDKLVAARDEANEAIQENNAMIPAIEEAQAKAVAEHEAQLAEVAEARAAMADESAALDEKRRAWDDDEAGGAATIERLEARVAELEAEHREIKRKEAEIEAFKGRL
jgi:chromosome segregation ATPase